MSKSNEARAEIGVAVQLTVKLVADPGVSQKEMDEAIARNLAKWQEQIAERATLAASHPSPVASTR